ncbi:slit homolog 2 protein [Trichonephila clavipes]|uniref:Slit homolog 2 protein n=1 Tax=Trichonephila clavipes TaxID=2585209 RepID=A0A8X6SR15_TRICX|nr:slit homolog 2 protein [Trichonephila clavipes]
MANKVFITKVCVLFSVFCLSFAGEDLCPPPEAVSPCECKNPEDPYIHCKKIREVDTIANMVERTGGMKFRYLLLENSSLLYLPTKALITDQFEGLMVTNTTLGALFDKPPSSHNSIKTIILLDVTLQRSLQFEKFLKVTKLENLTLLHTTVKFLGKDFKECISPSLTTLYMAWTKTSGITDGAFENLKSLEHLYITRNHIRKVKRSMFPSPASLKTIDWQSNAIEELPDDIFSDMPNLKFVVLRDNKITLLAEPTFGSILSHLSSLNVDKNPISCNCTFNWIVSRDHSKIIGTCHDPDFQEGKRIKELTDKDFNHCS